jgi:uncharacterized membrane protein
VSEFPRDTRGSRVSHRAVPVGEVHQDAVAGRHPLWANLIIAVSVIGTNYLVLTQTRLPFIGPAVGFWFILLLPIYLLCTTAVWTGCSGAERIGYCLCAVLLVLMVSGLTVNAVLPLVTSRQPLSTVPIVILADLINLSLFVLRRMRPNVVSWRQSFAAIRGEEARLASMALLSVVLAVLGANRLNNGAGDLLSLAAIGLVLLTLVCQVYWASKVREAVVCATLYLISLSLLFTTSLRGWYVTGHDIQNEYRVFQLTADHGHWSMAYWQNSYNACLSITILPTEISRVVGIDDPYVYKVLFQLLFAMCPVLVYAIGRRYWSPSVAVLAAAYFIGFPTFFTDMPFLNRQEIGYLFVAAAVLAATNPDWSLRKRQIALVLAGVGVELSHYSSMYFFFGALAIAWASRQVSAVLQRWFPLRSPQPDADYRRKALSIDSAVTFSSVLVLGIAIFVWGGLATQTSGQVVTAAKSALTVFSGHLDGARSGNVGYSLFGGKTPSQQTLLHNFRDETLKSVSTAPESYLPSSSLSKIATPTATQSVRPLSGVGRTLASVDIPVVGVNALLRQLAAYGEQLFIGVGLLELVLTLRRRRDVDEGFVWLCFGSIVMVGLITVLPGISTDYGVLRAFQEALITGAPVIVLGSTAVLRWFRRPRVAVIVGPVICFGLFAITSSLVPQVIGGNQPELNLNNSGSYYDAYYNHPQEEAAVGWLAKQPFVMADGLQGSYEQDRFAFMNSANVSGNEVIADIFPTLIRRSSWALLSYSMVHGGTAVTSLNGDLVEYRYPLSILELNKNLVYNNGGSEIYK